MIVLGAYVFQILELFKFLTMQRHQNAKYLDYKAQSFREGFSFVFFIYFVQVCELVFEIFCTMGVVVLSRLKF